MRRFSLSANDLQMTIHMQRMDIFDAMHRV